MRRFKSAARAATVVVLSSLLLLACRMPNETTSTNPGATEYPGPIARPPTKVVQAATPVPLATVQPSPAGAGPAPARTTGSATLTLTVLHTSDVSGEVSPCG
jgi:hypothetical protein